MNKRQRGISLIGTLIIAVLVIGAIILGMRTVPVYNEYFSVKKALASVVASGDAQSPESLRNAFQRRADVDDIDTVKAKDLEISKDGNRYVVAAQWERRIPLVANVALVFSFSASSSGDSAAAN
jgi:Tfp pilus assembly protein PilV